MATLTSRGCYAVATVDTERTIDGTIFREKWALRSDGAILRRIVWTDDGEHTYSTRTGRTTRLQHNNAYGIVGRLRDGVPMTADTLHRIAGRRAAVVTR